MRSPGFSLASSAAVPRLASSTLTPASLQEASAAASAQDRHDLHPSSRSASAAPSSGAAFPGIFAVTVCCGAGPKSLSRPAGGRAGERNRCRRDRLAVERHHAVADRKPATAPACPAAPLHFRLRPLTHAEADALPPLDIQHARQLPRAIDRDREADVRIARIARFTPISSPLMFSSGPPGCRG